MNTFSVYFVADTVLDYVVSNLNKLSLNRIKCKKAEYNQVSQVLLSEAKSDYLIVWTSPDIQINQYSK